MRNDTKVMRTLCENLTYRVSTKSLSQRSIAASQQFRDFLANVGDLADRARLLPDSSIPGDRDTIRHDLGTLAGCEQLLIGRRFIDQLRAPKRPSGRAASVLSGPRTAEEEEEEAQAFGHPSDETERDDAEDGFDLEEELAAIDKIDEEELGLDDDEEAPEDLEDDEVPTGLVAGVALLFASARDEMISAVNSLPLKGRMVHKRVVVAKLRKSAQVAPRNVVLGLPDVMKKLAGRTPQHVCFPPEIVKELDPETVLAFHGLTCPGLRLPSLLHWMVPRLPQASLTRHVPSLKGARVKRDKSNGNSAENKNKCETVPVATGVDAASTTAKASTAILSQILLPATCYLAATAANILPSS
ncbi:Putative ATP-dependent RNA helicase A [Durusdinium trenchii]|uniref:ATP-dependent RNA helicase A n=1 Tax=Durusdinium trenchii TaxID=1381693 RepID=A0ABP0L993_9DINO